MRVMLRSVNKAVSEPLVIASPPSSLLTHMTFVWLPHPSPLPPYLLPDLSLLKEGSCGSLPIFSVFLNPGPLPSSPFYISGVQLASHC